MNPPLRFSLFFISVSLLFVSCGKKEETTAAVPVSPTAQPQPVAPHPDEITPASPAPAVTTTASAPAETPKPAISSIPLATPTTGREIIVQGMQELLTLVSLKARTGDSSTTTAMAQIPLPEAVEKVRQPLITAGQGYLLQQLSQTGQSLTEARQLIPQAAAQLNGYNLNDLLQCSDGATQLLKKKQPWLVEDTVAAPGAAGTGKNRCGQDLSGSVGRAAAGIREFTGQSGENRRHFTADRSLPRQLCDRFYVSTGFCGDGREEAKIPQYPAAYSAKIQQHLHWKTEKK